MTRTYLFIKGVKFIVPSKNEPRLVTNLHNKFVYLELKEIKIIKSYYSVDE
jgi:hypothetical protein